MTMQRWEPAREITSLRNAFDRLFEESFVDPSSWFSGGERQGTIAMDMYQTTNDVVVKASLPGFKPEEVDISVTGDILIIKGAHQEEREAKEAEFFFRERHYGSFSRAVTIPVAVKSDSAEATFENGVLTLTLPKAEEAKPKHIKVKTKPGFKYVGISINEEGL